MSGAAIAIHLFAIVGAVWLAFREAGRLRERGFKLDSKSGFRRARAVMLCAAVMAVANLVVIALSASPSLAWKMPPAVDVGLLPIGWLITESCAVFVFATVVFLAFQTRHRDRTKLVFAAALSALAIELAYWRANAPIHASLTESVTSDGIILQSSGVSCAAASCANIGTLLGTPMSEKEAARLLGTSMHGTSVGQIVIGMESRGFACRKVDIESDRLTDISPPAVLMVDHPALGPESHAVALVRVEEDAFEVWDPLFGSEIMTADKLGSIWRRRAVEISRAGE